MVRKENQRKTDLSEKPEKKKTPAEGNVETEHEKKKKLEIYAKSQW